MTVALEGVEVPFTEIGLTEGKATQASGFGFAGFKVVLNDRVGKSSSVK